MKQLCTIADGATGFVVGWLAVGTPLNIMLPSSVMNDVIVVGGAIVGGIALAALAVVFFRRRHPSP